MQSTRLYPEPEAWRIRGGLPQGLPTWFTLGFSCFLKMASMLLQVLVRWSPSSLRFLQHQPSQSCGATGLESAF